MDQPVTKQPVTKNENRFRGAVITHYGDPWTGLPDTRIQYLAFAKETCPTTSRIHYQTWAYAAKVMRFSTWQKIFPGDCIFQMRGTFEQNDTYCSKEGELVTFGTRPMGNGKKRSLDELCQAVTQAAEDGIYLSQVVAEPENQTTFV